jgi:hypothetical protein
MNIADMGAPTLVADNLLGFPLPNRVFPEARKIEIVVFQVRQLSAEFAGPHIAVVIDDAKGFARCACHWPTCGLQIIGVLDLVMKSQGPGIGYL